MLIPALCIFRPGNPFSVYHPLKGQFKKSSDLELYWIVLWFFSDIDYGSCSWCGLCNLSPLSNVILSLNVNLLTVCLVLCGDQLVAYTLYES